MYACVRNSHYCEGLSWCPWLQYGSVARLKPFLSGYLIWLDYYQVSKANWTILCYFNLDKVNWWGNVIYTCVIEKTDKAGQLLPKILEQILELGPIKSVCHGTHAVGLVCFQLTNGVSVGRSPRSDWLISLGPISVQIFACSINLWDFWKKNKWEKFIAQIDKKIEHISSENALHYVFSLKFSGGRIPFSCLYTARSIAKIFLSLEGSHP